MESPPPKITIAKPLSIDMINMCSSLGSIVDLDKLINEFEPDDIVTGIKYKNSDNEIQIKGIVPETKAGKKKKKELEKGIKKKIEVSPDKIKKTFKHQVTAAVVFNNKVSEPRLMYVKIFISGSLHMPGMKNKDDAELLTQIVKDKITYALVDTTPGTCVLYEKSMYAVGYKLDNIINRNKLISIINKMQIDGVYTKFDQENYQGAIIKYPFPDDEHRKSVTVIIHKSGSISIKGANTEEKIKIVYKFINKIINSNYKEVIIVPQVAAT